MFTVTEAAGALLAQMLAEVDTSEKEGIVIRMCTGKDGLSLALSEADPGDTTFAHDGATVFVVDEELSQTLADKTLDVETTDDDTTLQLR